MKETQESQINCKTGYNDDEYSNDHKYYDSNNDDDYVNDIRDPTQIEY